MKYPSVSLLTLTYFRPSSMRIISSFDSGVTVAVAVVVAVVVAVGEEEVEGVAAAAVAAVSILPIFAIYHVFA